MKKVLTAGALIAAGTVAAASPAAAAAPAKKAPRVKLSLSQKHAGDKVLLTSKVFDLPRGDRAVSYSVDFGDGSSPRTGKKLPRLLHTYTRSGPTTVHVTVRDKRGRLFRSTAHLDVQLAPSAAAPVPATVSLPGCSAGAAKVAGPAKPVEMPAVWYAGMYAAVNTYRVTHGAKPVGVGQALATAASNWAYDIAAQSTAFAHGGLPSCLTGQSIAAGAARSIAGVTPSGLVSLLVSDAEHRAVMLQPQAKAAGIGVWYVPSLGEDVAVLNLGSA